jgi:hypothetical protein
MSQDEKEVKVLVVDRKMVLVATRRGGLAWSGAHVVEAAKKAKELGTQATWDMRHPQHIVVFGGESFSKAIPGSVLLNSESLSPCHVSDCTRLLGFTPQWKG